MQVNIRDFIVFKGLREFVCNGVAGQNIRIYHHVVFVKIAQGHDPCANDLWNFVDRKTRLFCIFSNEDSVV